MIRRYVVGCAAVWAIVGASNAAVWAAEVDPAVQQQLDELRHQVEEQNRLIQQLLERERERSGQPIAAPSPVAAPSMVPAAAPAPAVTPAAAPVQAASAPSEPTKPTALSANGFEAGYEKGFYIRSIDKARVPFSLRLNARMQVRYTYFDPQRRDWTDNAGVTRDIKRESYFELERGRLTFEGTALDPKLGYYINLDYDSDDANDVIAHDYWLDYVFTRGFGLFGGKTQVPGSRDWLNGSTRMRLVDRSMATTFFRPDRTIGIWAEGEPLDQVFYKALIGNGFNSGDVKFDQLDTQFVYSASVWADVTGTYGQGYSDLEWHEQPATLIGTSFTFAKQNGADSKGVPLSEQNFLRLSDGTPVTESGALSPGVTVDKGEIYLYALDWAAKYRGFSLNSEYFFRWIQGLDGSGAGVLGIHQFFDHGFYLEGGYFIWPKLVELEARTSQIFGRFGNAAEYAGGVNWFVNGTHNFKLSLDATKLHRNPAQNAGPNLRAGDDGILVRTQVQVGF